jgi:hypothetical protein
MVKGFAKAVSLYREVVPAEGREQPWVLFVIDEHERNVTDQKLIETYLQINHGIQSIRATFVEIGREMQVDS